MIKSAGMWRALPGPVSVAVGFSLGRGCEFNTGRVGGECNNGGVDSFA